MCEDVVDGMLQAHLKTDKMMFVDVVGEVLQFHPTTDVANSFLKIFKKSFS